MSEFIDVSMEMSDRLAVFPGDTALSREVLLDTAKGDHLTLSTLRTTVHAGTHLDAPNHYGGTTPIDEVPLARTCGRCLVVDCGGGEGRPRISIEDLASGLAALEIGAEEALPARVLLASRSFPDPERWSSSFRGLEPALVDHLADRGAGLVGVDTPSVDTADSKDLPAHARCLVRDVLILEGLRLDRVEPGFFELLCLPLRLVGFDASPVRAVLRRID